MRESNIDQAFHDILKDNNPSLYNTIKRLIGAALNAEDNEDHEKAAEYLEKAIRAEDES